MTGVTPQGIRFPNNPSDYADIIKFFKEMADDVDSKFVPKTGNTAITGELQAKTFKSTNGGTTQSATVLQTGPSSSSAFTFYDDNQRIDGVAGRRLWISGANGTDVAIRTRSGSDNLNRISLRAATVDIQSNVTITGTLNVSGMKTVHGKWEGNTTLVANATWRLVYAANVGVSFVCPPSGAVLIGFGGSVPAEGYSTFLSYEIRSGATIGGGSVVFPHIPSGWDDIQPPPHGVAANGTGSGSTQWHTTYNPYRCGSGEGLSPGQTYHIRPWYRNKNPASFTLYRSYAVVEPDL